MDNILHTKDVDEAVDAFAGVVLTSDTVAIWDIGMEMYGIYKKAENNKYRWDLVMTSFTLNNITEE